jgi:hypothetical protein
MDLEDYEHRLAWASRAVGARKLVVLRPLDYSDELVERYCVWYCSAGSRDSWEWVFDTLTEAKAYFACVYPSVGERAGISAGFFEYCEQWGDYAVSHGQPTLLALRERKPWPAQVVAAWEAKEAEEGAAATQAYLDSYRWLSGMVPAPDWAPY